MNLVTTRCLRWSVKMGLHYNCDYNLSRRKQKRLTMTTISTIAGHFLIAGAAAAAAEAADDPGPEFLYGVSSSTI